MTTRRRRKQRTSVLPIQSFAISAVQPYEGEVESNIPQTWDPEVLDKKMPEFQKDTSKMPKSKLFYWKFFGKRK